LPSLTGPDKTLNFGGVELGTSATGTLTFVNSGNGQGVSQGFSIAGSDYDRFSFESWNAIIPPNSTTQIKITFTPTRTHTSKATIVISFPSISPDTYWETELIGWGVERKPEVTMETSVLDFGQGSIGQQQTLELTVTNSGREVLHVEKINLNATTFTATPQTFDLEPGTTQQVQVSLTRQQAGVIAGKLTLHSNDPAGVSHIKIERANLNTAGISIEPQGRC
jgi:hypothetical protein